MMRRQGEFSGVVMLAAALFAGCAQTQTRVGQTTERRWRPIDNEQVMKARNAPVPKIAPETHFAAGILLEQQGQPGQAIEQYRRAIALNHQYAEAYHRLGVLQGMTGQHADAETNLRKAVALKPQQAFFRNDLGFELMQQQDWARAEEQFRAALDLYPRMPRANINLGLALSQQGRYEEALACFRTALAEPDAQYNLGLVFKQQQRHGEAAACFRRALAERPVFPAASTQLAYCEQSMGGMSAQPPVTQVTPVFVQSGSQPPASRPEAMPTTSFTQRSAPTPTGTSESAAHTPRTRTMSAQTLPEERTIEGPPSFDAVTAPPAQPVEWIEVQTSNDAASDDPITGGPGDEPSYIAPRSASKPQAGRSGATPEFDAPGQRVPLSDPEPMPFTTSGPVTPQPAAAVAPIQPSAKPQVQPSPRTAPQPMAPPAPQPRQPSSGDVHFVPLSDVGSARPAGTSAPSSNFARPGTSAPQSNAAPIGGEPQPPARSLTTDEQRTRALERRAQAAWLEEQRTGKRAKIEPTYYYEAKYTTQVAGEAGSRDDRSTMAASVDFPAGVNARGQGPLPAERPLEWLETVAYNNRELEIALNNLRCESQHGAAEMDYSPLDAGAAFETIPMSIVPPESPAVPAPRPEAIRAAGTTVTTKSTAGRSSESSSSSGAKVVPMTDPGSRR